MGQRSPVRYSQSGDIYIAYQVVGDGPPDLVWVPGALSNLDLWWDLPQHVRMFERLASFSRLILFDKRGTGLSDRPATIEPLEERINDIRAAMDGADSEAAHVFGHSESGSMACLFAATYPSRTRSLILWGTRPRFTRTPDYPWGPTYEELEERWRRQAAANWEIDFAGPAMRAWLGALADDRAFVEWFTRMWRTGASPAARVALWRMNARIDIRAILPAIRVPTLLLVREDDPVVSVDEARAMASMIPGARFEVVPGRGHVFLDHWEPVIALIQEFITGVAPVVAADRVLTTVLVQDIVGSTELVAQIGDASWRNLLDRYYTVARRNLAAFGGAEVDTAGDGLLATFDGPARAVRCAGVTQREAESLRLRVRAGVHTGEVERVNRDIRGIAVHTAARIASLAGAGEVLVSSTVRDLVEGSGITFRDRGVHSLKGVPTPRQLFAATA